MSATRFTSASTAFMRTLRRNSPSYWEKKRIPWLTNSESSKASTKEDCVSQALGSLAYFAAWQHLRGWTG